MAKQLNETVGKVTFETLIVDACPPADVYSITIRKGTEEMIFKRGTVFALSTGTAGDGKLVLLGTTAAENETLTANCILAENVTVGTTGDVTALAYRTGHFNRKALIVGAGYTLKPSDEEALRNGGILLSDAMNY